MWNLAPSGKALWTLLRSFYAAKGILSMAGGSLRLRYCPDKLLPKPTFDGNSIAKLLVVYERVERVRIVNRVLPTQSYTLYVFKLELKKVTGSGLLRLFTVATMCGPLHLLLTVTLGASHWWGSYPFACGMPSLLPWWKQPEAKGDQPESCGKSGNLQ